jgi:hypothetical protein
VIEEGLFDVCIADRNAARREAVVNAMGGTLPSACLTIINAYSAGNAIFSL